jgi:hypothetical protein
MSFIVHSPSTFLFRVHFSSVSIVLKEKIDLKNVFANCNFDNYRNFKTKSFDLKAGKCHFEGYENIFIYETQFAPFLGVKIFQISILGQELTGEKHYVGQMEIDLQTIFTGPPQITLLIKDGDFVVGRGSMVIRAQQLIQTVVRFEQLKVTTYGGSAVPSLCKWTVFAHKKNKAGEYIEIKYPVQHAKEPNACYFQTDDVHIFAMSCEDLETEGVIHFVVKDGGGLFADELGSFDVSITKNVKQRQLRRKSIAGQFAITASETRQARLRVLKGLSESEDIPNLAGDKELDEDERHTTHDYADADFVWALDFTGKMNPGEHKAYPLEITGRCLTTRLPEYVQMIEGITVDGVVCNGVPFPRTSNNPKPLFLDQEDSDV